MKKKKTLIISLIMVFIIIIAIGIILYINMNKKAKTLDCVIEKQEYTIFNFSYLVTGHCVNNSSKDYSHVKLFFKCYNKEGKYVGDATGNNKIGKTGVKKGETLEYTAMLNDNGSKKVDYCDFDRVEVKEAEKSNKKSN